MSQRSSPFPLSSSEASESSGVSNHFSSIIAATGSSSSGVAILTTGEVSTSIDRSDKSNSSSNQENASVAVSLKTIIAPATVEVSIASDTMPVDPLAPVSSPVAAPAVAIPAGEHSASPSSLNQSSAANTANLSESTNWVEIVSLTLPAVPISNRLIGNAKNDRIRGSQNHDLIVGRSGDDYLIGALGNDRILGGIGKDILQGGDDDDWLNGGEGNDLLNGGSGSDRLVGAGGADTFVLQHPTTDSLQTDIVVDFRAAQGDKLKLAQGLSVRTIQLEVIDFDCNGNADATLIRSNKNSEIVAVVLDTVSAVGQTVLQDANFI